MQRASHIRRWDGDHKLTTARCHARMLNDKKRKEREEVPLVSREKRHLAWARQKVYFKYSNPGFFLHSARGNYSNADSTASMTTYLRTVHSGSETSIPVKVSHASANKSSRTAKTALTFVHIHNEANPQETLH